MIQLSERRSHADVDVSVSVSSREVKLFSAFVVPVFIHFLSPAAKELSERIIRLVGRDLSLFKSLKD